MKNPIYLTVLAHSSCISAALSFISMNFAKHLILIPPSVAKLLNNILSLPMLCCILTYSYILNITSLLIMIQCYQRHFINESRSEQVKPAHPMSWSLSWLETCYSVSQFQQASPHPNNPSDTKLKGRKQLALSPPPMKEAKCESVVPDSHGPGDRANDHVIAMNRAGGTRLLEVPLGK